MKPRVRLDWGSIPALSQIALSKLITFFVAAIPNFVLPHHLSPVIDVDVHGGVAIHYALAGALRVARYAA